MEYTRLGLIAEDSGFKGLDSRTRNHLIAQTGLIERERNHHTLLLYFVIDERVNGQM